MPSNFLLLHVLKSSIFISPRAKSDALNNPSNFQTGITLSWDIPGTDANNKKWALYNASITANSGKIFLGKDNVETYFGTGYDASIYYNGTDLEVFINDALVARVASPTIGASATTLTNALLVPTISLTPVTTETINVDYLLAAQEIAR